MSVNIQLDPKVEIPPDVQRVTVFLRDDGYYWWLYRYFEAANLPPRKGELIDLYGYAAISGYQLELLRRELLEARFDASHRPEEWRVVIGWDEARVSAETERVSVVRKADMLKVIEDLLLLVEAGLKRNIAVVCVGD